MSIDYNFLSDQSNRFLVREALKLINCDKCNLYISFYTDSQDIKMSPELYKKYPERMAIVLQHQFRDLAVYNNYFSIQVSFDGVFEKIEVPFAMVEVFHDKEADFYLKLDKNISAGDSTLPSFEDNFDDDTNKIISIDKFLKQ